MIALALCALTCIGPSATLAAEAGGPDSGEALALLERALAVAESIEDAPSRADAVGRVAAALASIDPRRSLTLVEAEAATHLQSEAMARAAEALARDNRFLGLATLIRVSDRSAVLEALARIVAMEALQDLDEAIDIVEKIENLPVRRVVERDVARVLWADVGSDQQQAVEVAVAWADTISDAVTHGEALAYAAEGAAGYDLARAEEIAGRIPAGDARDLAWRLVVQRTSPHEPMKALGLLRNLETPLQRSLAGTAVVAGLVAAGEKEQAVGLGREIRALAESGIEDLRDQGLVLAQLALATVDVDSAYALSVLTGVWPPVERYATQALVARSGNHPGPDAQRALIEDAWVEVRRVDAPLIERQIASAALVAAEDVAPELIETMLKERPDLVQAALPDAVGMVVSEPELALKLAERIEDRVVRETAKAEIAAQTARAEPALARQITDGLTVSSAKSAALVALARAAMPRAVD